MSDEPVRSFLNERTPSPKLRTFWPQRYRVIVPLCFILFAGVIGTVIFLQPVSWFSNTHAKDIAFLKNQAAALNSRVDYLEAAGKTPPIPFIEPERIKDIEVRIAALYQQVEVIQNQPKVEASPHGPEQSLVLEKEVIRLAETQKTLKSALLFWRLKAKILSEAPYTAELTDFKKAINQSNGLGILEQYATQGLQVLKETPKDLLPSSDNETNSWWKHLKTIAASFIKIEKVDAPVPPPSSFSQDRQAIEEALAQLDQTLAQQLAAVSLAPSPLPGDAL